MTYVPECGNCLNGGYLWVAFDCDDKHVDVTKPFSGRKPPVPQLCPCSCFRGVKVCSGASEKFRKLNAQYGFPEVLQDGRKGIEVINEQIEKNFSLCSN